MSKSLNFVCRTLIKDKLNNNSDPLMATTVIVLMSIDNFGPNYYRKSLSISNGYVFLFDIH